jgi:short chain dehydrogenase
MSVSLRRWKRDCQGTFRVHPKRPHLNAYNTSIISGLALVQALLTHNAKVYMAARSQGKAEEAIKELKDETGKEGIFLKLDLSDLKSVKAAAEEFHRSVCLKTAFFLCLTFIS